MNNLIVCSKCGATAAVGTPGWLVAQRYGPPEGYLMVRCPKHISQHARRQAGLPQQNRTTRISENLDRGLWIEHAGIVTAVKAGDAWDGESILETGESGMPPFRVKTFRSLPDLITAMRQVEPDLRKWRLTEA